ncbi:hypothetical protein HG536_0C04310 [Torulaspora globosa]|uniref:Peptidase A1 domain-containing protein n=1 Tax=Torulaspora globosa TaxID=48254 RepID=A0A7G3ZFH6_9SACH|nr:uncharacterized protein HG536_0C04310 [Torulaspora globosa]QLL32262.1 hypothetical protein HG536_0C04310 [Torulaspora globosa]
MWFPKIAGFILVVFILVSLVRSRPTPGLGHLHLPIHKSESRLRSKLKRRSFAEIELLHESDVYYSTVLNIGTPGQEVSVVMDTGSADLWVASSSNPYCLNSVQLNQTYNGEQIEPSIDCSALGTFDANSSSSIKKLDIGRFFINYSDGSFADGYWASEKISMGEIDVSELQFGVADYATAPIGGVLGIGFARRESVRGYDNAPGRFYPNFPQVLKQGGVIDVVAYSLYLSEAGGDSGSILFGAVDPSRYIGPLYTFPMVNEYPEVVDKPATLAMTLQGIGAKSDRNCKSKTFSTTKLPVLLDSGTTFMSAPPEIADEMASFVGATFSENDGVYIFQCPADDDDTEFVFDFGDIKIAVPLRNFLLLPPSNGYCGFGVMPAPYSMTLGSAFLSSAYVVYDLDNYLISLAQANHDGSSSQDSFVKVGKQGGIPGATKATAIAWVTDEPIAVDYDIFASSKSCNGATSQTNPSSSDTSQTLSPVSTNSRTAPANATLSLQVDATPDSSYNLQVVSSRSVIVKSEESATATGDYATEEYRSHPPQYITVTCTVTAIETIVSRIDCRSND